VGLTTAWDPTFGEFLEKTFQYYPKNLDHNSGNPLGIAVCQQGTHNGLRVTASGAFLNMRPPNLTVMTDTAITQSLFDGKKAIGVAAGQQKRTYPPDLGVRVSDLSDTVTVYAQREVILSGGSIDTPKILLLSGIGPANDLRQLGIPIIHDLPGVGKNLNDRLFLELVTTQKPGSHHRTSYVDSLEKLEEARKQWTVDQTGPLSDYYMPQMIGYFQSDRVLASEEFQTLDLATQEALRARTKPSYEIISVSPAMSPIQIISYLPSPPCRPTF